MKKTKNRRRNVYRLAIQFSIVGILAYMLVRLFLDKSYQADFEAYCPYGGLMAYSSFLVNNTLACSMTSLQIAMAFMLIAAIVLFSKLFCSYLCPIGMFTEWLGKWGEKFKVRYTIRGTADKALRLLKYVLLFITVYFTVTSSELFCRKFDPFYAVFTGFGHDTDLVFAISALLITILGSFFIRQFWCKYLCPLGAASNLFAFTLYFVAISGIFLLFELVFKLGVHWTIYVGILCLVGFLLEAFKTPRIFPVFKVTRHDNLCTHCKICDKVCPYALPISTEEHVRHIDCHLCGDCVTKCPEKGALTYNKRRMNWLPAVSLILLILGGIVLSRVNQVPTIDMKWGSAEEMENAQVYYQDGIKNIKCYGSSMSFATQIKEIPGILGVQTFVKNHSVKIFFNPEILTAEKVKELIFNPVKELFQLPSSGLKEIGVLKTGIDHFFDANDEYYLSEILRREKGILAFETSFGEPVHATFYYDKSLINKEKIISLIESKSISFGEGDEQKIFDLDFKVAFAEESSANLSTEEFIQGLFTPYVKTFNDYEKCDTLALLKYEVAFPQCLFSENKPMIPYLRNHLMSADKGLVKFETLLQGTEPVLRLYYIEGKTTPEKIFMSLNKEKLTIHYKDGTVGEEDNPFNFPDIGTTHP